AASRPRDAAAWVSLPLRVRETASGAGNSTSQVAGKLATCGTSSRGLQTRHDPVASDGAPGRDWPRRNRRSGRGAWLGTLPNNGNPLDRGMNATIQTGGEAGGPRRLFFAERQSEREEGSFTVPRQLLRRWALRSLPAPACPPSPLAAPRGGGRRPCVRLAGRRPRAAHRRFVGRRSGLAA